MARSEHLYQGKDFAAAMPPSAFASVMATGIVAIATAAQGALVVSHLLFAASVLLLAAQGALLALRLARHRERVADDLRHPVRSPGFFTFVAGTAVVGSGCVVFDEPAAFAQALFALAALSWCVVTYAVFGCVITAREKQRHDTAPDAAWLLSVVATQSVSVLGSLVAQAAWPEASDALAVASVGAWLGGCALYAVFITLLLQRAMFRAFAPSDLPPAWWIAMGAMAISTLAGSLLVLRAGEVAWLAGLLPALLLGTLLCWVVATLWLPLLVVLHAWRLRAEPGAPLERFAHWSAVFPLGMYSVATGRMAQALHLPALHRGAVLFCWIALGAWVWTAGVRTREAMRGVELRRG